ncbi:MAG TPA: polyribonucleotide nucleotidyltransferase, partial [Anaerolineae bacterium]|nr:polyribonucleotide nucleotidyltransferase [Anaerolineae bacterium]
MNEAKTFTTTVGRDTITVETGKLANQAGGAVTVRLGDTVVLTTATMARSPREGIDFFPLSVEYEERLYAAGRIPGSFFRREGRPSESSILVCRLTDRPLRPLFPEDFRNDVQIVITSLSSDTEHQVDILAINGASAALTISEIPFQGPIGAVRVGYIDGKFIVNPTSTEMDNSQLDLRIAGTADAILMVECGANELPEAVMVEALEFGHQALQPMVELQNKMRAQLGRPKNDSYPKFGVPAEVFAAVKAKIGSGIEGIMEKGGSKADINDAMEALQKSIVEAFK